MQINLPKEILAYCETEFGHLKQFRSVSGGCINNGGCLTTGRGTIFIKWNYAKHFPGMFRAEQRGLQILAHANTVRIPKVIDRFEGDEYECLILEWIDSSLKREGYWQALGQQLATLHGHTQKNYGLDHDNYIGSLPQGNSPDPDWISFFITQRLVPQVKRALNAGKMTTQDVKKFDLLYKNLPAILVAEVPALTHGDLWSGNVMTDNKGMPVLIDPAVAYTHREVDLAFTTLFGGFDQHFYQAYHESYPLENGYEDRLDIYNIYPLLVHVNLFGGGYHQQVMSTLNRFI